MWNFAVLLRHCFVEEWGCLFPWATHSIIIPCERLSRNKGVSDDFVEITQACFTYHTAAHSFCSLGKFCVQSSGFNEPGGSSVPRLSSGFPLMKQLRALLLPPGWDASPLQDYPPQLTSTHLYTWLERDYVQEYSFVGYRNNNTFRDQPPTTDPLIA